MSLGERLRVLVHGRLASWHESESTIAIGRGWCGSERDRQAYSRVEVLEDALEAWRLNPLARRIIGLATQYVVGGGLGAGVQARATRQFLRQFWQHPLNRLDVRLHDLCDELARSGNLFVLVSSDPAGMSYLRCIPAADVGGSSAPQRYRAAGALCDQKPGRGGRHGLVRRLRRAERTQPARTAPSGR